MISLDELNKIKEEKKTNLYYEEKEYIQYIFLNALSKFSDKFVFKGGTCLKICYGLERASEDLDFSTNMYVNKIKEVVRKCMKDFELLGMEYEIYSEKEFEGNLRIEARFKGPLFQGKKASTNTLKIDFNKRKSKHKVAKVIQKLFSDVPLFTMVALDEKEILAEKIRTLINRGEPRDLYDIWVMFSKKINVDKKFLAEKLKEEKSNISDLKLPSKEEYEVDLKNLLNFLPDYEQVKKEVENELKRILKKT